MEEPGAYATKAIDQDGLWKKIINELFEDFLIFFVPDLWEQIDFSQEPDFLQQELFQEIIDQKKGRRYADQVVKVQLQNGEKKWILIHIEVQSDEETDFSERMFQYFYRLYDRHKQKIVALAVITSPTEIKPQSFYYNYFGTKLHYEYTNRRIFDYDERELEQSNKLFSKIVLATQYMHKTKSDADKRFAFKTKLMREIVRNKAYSREAVQAMFHFIDYLLRLPPELSKKLASSIRPLLYEEERYMLQANREDPSPTLAEIFKLEREEGIKKGLKEGEEKGREEGKKDAQLNIAKKLLMAKNISVKEIAELTELTVDEVEKLKKPNIIKNP